MARIDIDVRVDRIQLPENLRFSQLVSRQRELCDGAGCSEPFFSFGRTESPFPIPEEIKNTLQGQDSIGNLADPAGLSDLKKAVAGFYSRHYNLRIEPDRVIIGHGVKGLVFPIFTLLSGSVIVPSPGWLGYLPQLRILNKPYYRLFGHLGTAYKIRIPTLAALLKGLVKSQHLLILNNPGYPTGVLYTEKELREIADVCREYNTMVLANEAYSLLTYDQSQFVSMGSVYPEGTFILNGLSMDRAAGGLRIGTCIMPEGCEKKVIDEFVKVLATVYTASATPVQQAAISAYLPNPSMDAYLHDTREIHRIMTKRLAALCGTIDKVRITNPDGGFSFMVDLNAFSSKLQAAGIQYSNDLAPALIQHPYHIATVSGEAMMAAYADFYIRFSANDYNGSEALEAYRAKIPAGETEEEDFFNRFGSRMIAGMEKFRIWIDDLKAGNLTYTKEI